MDASAAKRRVLGALDPNASRSLSPKKTTKGLFDIAKVQLQSSGLNHQSPASPLKKVAIVSPSPACSPRPELKKRPLAVVEEEDTGGREREPLSAKKQCLAAPNAGAGTDVDVYAAFPSSQTSLNEQLPQSPGQGVATTTRRQHSASPAPSSVFDSSGLDASQATLLTEPDTEAPPSPSLTARALASAALAHHSIPAPPPRLRLTRQQTREKVEILRLRLGLASYKLRTGQTDVPLEQLERMQMRRLPPSRPAISASMSVRRDQASRPQAAVPPVRRPLPSAPRTSKEEISSRHGDRDSNANSRSRQASHNPSPSPKPEAGENRKCRGDQQGPREQPQQEQQQQQSLEDNRTEDRSARAERVSSYGSKGPGSRGGRSASPERDALLLPRLAPAVEMMPRRSQLQDLAANADTKDVVRQTDGPLRGRSASRLFSSSRG